MPQDTTKGARRLRCPEDVLAWIPWYADGGLTAREQGAVEAHAAQCGDCRAEIDIITGAPWAVEGVALPDADRLFDEITARIEAADRGERATVIPISRGRALSDADLARIEQWVRDPEFEREPVDEASTAGDASVERATSSEGGSPVQTIEIARPLRRGLGTMAPLWAAAAALVLFAAGVLSGSFGRTLLARDGEVRSASEGADYQLASAKPVADSSAGAPAIDVVFSDSASAREIWSTLRGLGVEIVSGPSNLGVYRLRLLPAAVEGRDPTTADAAAIAARLVAQDSPLAIFAEPVP